MQEIIRLLSEYKYIILFPMAIVEGPVIAIIAGLLCTKGFLFPLPVFVIIVAGDVTGDSLCYTLGRLGLPSFLKKPAAFFGLNAEKINQARKLFETNPVKSISLSKIILGIGVAGIYLAGNTKIPYGKFFRICLVTSFVQYLFYLGTGLLFGHAYVQINHYLNAFATISILAAAGLLFFLFIKSILRKI